LAIEFGRFWLHATKRQLDTPRLNTGVVRLIPMSKEMAGPDQGSDWDDEDSPLEVQDDGSVDQKIKKRILDARKRVDDREEL